MNKILIVLMAVLVFFSGCTGPKTVKNGDNISVDYVGSLLDGKVFDTSIEKIAKENNITKPEYKPLEFTVGNGSVIKGFDEGVVGMKVGETRIMTISPEKGYGPSNPQMIQVMPIFQDMPLTRVIPKVFEVPKSQFEQIMGPGHKIGEIVLLPKSNINLTILNITSNVSLSYHVKLEDELWSQGEPWNETVIKIDNNNITLKANVSKNDVIQFQGAPWNTTVVGLNNVNITLRHNPIQATVIPSMFGQMRVSFNDTSILMDQNHELAGKTLVFNVTLRSIK